MQITGPVRMSGPGHVYLGAGCRVPKATFAAYAPGATIRVGAGTYLNGPNIVCTESVTIGERCEISDVDIFDTDFHSTQRAPRGDVRTGPVTIGDDVWLATRVVVLRGVTIGDRAVVGVGVVVAVDVPADAKVRQTPPVVT